MKQIKKRVSALVAATLLFGTLSAITSSSAEADAIADQLNLATSGSDLTEVVNLTGADSALSPTGAATTIKITEDAALVNTDDYFLYVSTSSTRAGITATNTLTISANTSSVTAGTVSTTALADDVDGATSAFLGDLGADPATAKALIVTPDAGNNDLGSVITFDVTTAAATSYYVWADPDTSDTFTGDSLLIAQFYTYKAVPTVTTSTSSASITSVRTSLTGAVLDSVPLATMSVTQSGAGFAFPANGRALLSITRAPSASAQLVLTGSAGTANFTPAANTRQVATLTQTALLPFGASGVSAADADGVIKVYLAADIPGIYGGTIKFTDVDGDSITHPFSITTAGKPATIAIDKDAVSLPSVSATTAVSNRSYVAATDTRTFTTSTAHNYSVGNVVIVAGIADLPAAGGVDETQLNGTCTISAVTGTTFSCVLATAADVNIAATADAGEIAALTAAATAKSLVVSQDVVVSLKDAAGNGTQIGTGDTMTVSVVDATNIAIQATGLGSTLTITDANLADNSHTVRIGSLTATADSETVTVTPNGVLPGLGVVAKTLTATTVAYGVTTSATTLVTSPSSSSVILKNDSVAQSDYSVDPGTASIVAETSGLEAGKAYRIGVLITDGGGAVQAGTYSVAGATAAAFTVGTAHYSYGIAPASGKVQTVIVFTTLMNNAADTVQINVSTADTDYTDTSDLLVTAAASAYTTTLTAPATTPSVAVTGAAIPVSGTIADQYGNPFVGATVTVVGAQTLSSGTAANLTAQAVTDTAGKFSVTLAAANALTTSVALTIDAARGGVSATQKTAAVNLNAGGAATAMAWAAIGDEDTATTATTHPLIVVPFDDGVVGGVTDELYTLATAAGDGTLNAVDECVGVEVNTTPLAQVTATGSEGVLFSSTICAAQKLSDLKSTVTVAAVAAAAGNNLWFTSTKTGKNTVTLTSGGVTKTITFYAQNYLTAATKGDAARDIVLDSAAKSLTGGEIGFITATVVDTFGNAVEQAAGISTVKAAITGAALLDGPSLSKSGLLAGSDGKVTLGIIAGNAAGSATLTVTGVVGTVGGGVQGGQFAALVGAPTSTTTAGTNTAFKASANVKTATITVTAASSTAVDAVKTDVTAVKADAKALSDSVATLSKAVTTIQSSVTELTSSFSAQIKSLSAAIAKISKAIAALSKKIK